LFKILESINGCPKDADPLFEEEYGLGSVRIGVFGGTFNPIHSGHLHIAQAAQSIFALSQVHFVVASVPPHKHPEGLIPFTHRYAMVSLAIARERSFIPSLVELEPEASPYTFDTMQKLDRSIGHASGRLFFIAGGDSLFEVKFWRESEKLLASYDFIFVMRPGTGPLILEEHLPGNVIPRVRNFIGLKRVQIRRRLDEERSEEKRIYLVEAGAPDISSTGIRNLSASDRAIRRMVPGPVREYIRKLHLYGGR
jgi:nicotinate-nucleotide adenylyltransferase